MHVTANLTGCPEFSFIELTTSLFTSVRYHSSFRDSERRPDTNTGAYIVYVPLLCVIS